jgi:glycine cleavage system protein P-like pyridoxal-binding family
MAGFKVVAVKNLPDGSLDIADLRAKAEKHKDKLGAFMASQISMGATLILTNHRLHTRRRLVCSRTASRKRAR